MKKTILLSSILALSTACSDASTTDAAPVKAEATAEPAKAASAETAPAEAKSVTEVSVDDVDQWLQGKAKVAVFDANGQSTREQMGVIPGATLLSSYREYNPADVLPEDKATKLVFYCGSTSCRASDGAAQKAVEAGYDDVCVLRAGIKGWKDAGKSTLTMAEAEAAQKPAAGENKEG